MSWVHFGIIKVKKSGNKILSIDMTAFRTEDSSLNAASLRCQRTHLPMTFLSDSESCVIILGLENKLSIELEMKFNAI